MKLKPMLAVLFVLLAGVPAVHSQTSPVIENEALKKGIAEYREENYEEAFEHLADARRTEPKSSIAAFYLGLVNKQTGKIAESAINFEEAVKFTPSVLDAYIELIEAYYNLGDSKKARRVISQAEKLGVRPAQVSYQKGLVLAKDNDNVGAIEAFRTAKQLDPALTQTVDMQIALAYAKDKRLTEARDALKAVISMNPTSEIASFAKEYETSLSKIIAEYKVWHFSVGATYQYDDNVVAAPSNDVPGLVLSGKHDGSVLGSLRVDYRPLQTGPWFWSAQYMLNTNNHFELKSHDTFVQSIGLIPGSNLSGIALTIPVSYSHVYLDEKEYQGLLSVRPTVSGVLPNGDIGQFSVGVSVREMFQDALMADEERGARILTIGAGVVHPFSDKGGMVNARYEYTREYTDGINWDNGGHRFSLSSLYPLGQSFSATASADAYINDYVNTHTSFNVKRQDRIYSLSAGLTWDVTRQVSLTAQYSFTRTDSNIAVYDYNRTVLSAGVEISF